MLQKQPSSPRRKMSHQQACSFSQPLWELVMTTSPGYRDVIPNDIFPSDIKVVFNLLYRLFLSVHRRVLNKGLGWPLLRTLGDPEIVWLFCRNYVSREKRQWSECRGTLRLKMINLFNLTADEWLLLMMEKPQFC